MFNSAGPLDMAFMDTIGVYGHGPHADSLVGHTSSLDLEDSATLILPLVAASVATVANKTREQIHEIGKLG
eukprot:CAMPEP_0172692382 /NCGR_PEP_ID=MMETSP1074-20121228/25213_1 /TAXON_ID=2916 /ORGANISM="Ceratium fusus, Strain PA161109" /LENGTH=70 /DNA_ID=CAMNT_0013512577 /DNA_START=315 /DNA_END=527 /DNA_ORIENTATION=-